MIPGGDNRFHGIYPSALLPLKSDYSIDETALAHHVSTLCDVPGVVGILCNAHAGENSRLDRQEQKRVVEIVSAAVGNRAIVVAGVGNENTLEACAHAQDAKKAGCDAVIVVAPNSWAISQDDDIALIHHQMIIEAADLPVMLFFGAVNAGALAYRAAVVEKLIRLANVVAVKEGSYDVTRYETNYRLVKRIAPTVAVLASADQHLLPCYVLGSDGSQLSLASVIPEAIVALDRAVRAGRLAEAQRIHHRIYPLVDAIYGTPPASRKNRRLKACLKLLGRFENDLVRPPVGDLDEQDVARLRRALQAAQVL